MERAAYRLGRKGVAWKKANPERAERSVQGGLIGSPETIRRKLHRFAQSKIDNIILLNQAGRNRHDHICESFELFVKGTGATRSRGRRKLAAALGSFAEELIIR